MLVLGPEAAKTLLGLSREALSAPTDTVLENPGLRLIPYRAVGQRGGMLLAARMEVKTEGRWEKRLAAFSPDPIGSATGYQALMY